MYADDSVSMATCHSHDCVCVCLIFYGRIECHCDICSTVDKQIQLIENYLFILLFDGTMAMPRSWSYNNNSNNNSARATPIRHEIWLTILLLHSMWECMVCLAEFKARSEENNHMLSNCILFSLPISLSLSLTHSFSMCVSFRFSSFFNCFHFKCINFAVWIHLTDASKRA